MALVNYMSQILVELIKLAALIINIIKALACASRIEEVFQLEPGMVEGTMQEPESNTEYIVEMEHASIAYNESGEESLSDVNLKVRPGEMIGIIGGTGSGKSTLVQLISRFYDVTSGSVKIHGVNVKDYTYEALGKMISIVPQKALLFKGTIRSNMEWGKKGASDDEIIDALKISQSYEFVMEKENTIDAVVEQNGKNFSGGQRQRLTIARAVVAKPDILILDDSSSALDYVTDLKLRQALRNLKNMTTFVVSQRTASIKDADHIVVLDDGQVMGIGTHEELLKNCETYQEIYDSQNKNEEGR